MLYGTKTVTETKNGITKVRSTKYHDGNVTRDETIIEERVPIIKISDATTVFDQMHLDHAFTSYGAWVEKNPTSGKLYVVKCWIEDNKDE